MLSNANELDGDMSEINMTPFVDVMLVLLIIFIVTVPTLNHSLTVKLPSAGGQALQTHAQALRLGVQSDGTYTLDGQSIAPAELERSLGAAGKLANPPDIEVRAAREVPYERVAKLISLSQQAGLKKFKFITQPS